MITSTLSLRQPISERMRSQGHCFYHGSEISLHSDMEADAARLKEAFAFLPPDPYAKHTTWGRRYGIFILVPDHNELLATSLSTYYQSAAYNHVDGGVRRVFAPLSEQLKANSVLQQLIRLDFINAPLDSGHHLFQVGAHLIRQTPPISGDAFTHGLHKDGEWVTFSHLISRVNVQGGCGVIADNNKNVIWEGFQGEFLDAFGVVDKQVYHMARPVRRADPSHEAWRDVLLIDFTPLIAAIPA